MAPRLAGRRYSLLLSRLVVHGSLLDILVGTALVALPALVVTTYTVLLFADLNDQSITA